MQPWMKEHGGRYAVPPEIDALVSAGLLADESWHNETSPRFVQDHGGMCIVLWVERPAAADREDASLPRFALMVEPSNDPGGISLDLYGGDNLQVVLYILQHAHNANQFKTESRAVTQ